ncbi:MAG: glycosyltransferase family 39 protein [bacterium]|nr:glycosyltransferase family 39 protein [bacterium]
MPFSDLVSGAGFLCRHLGSLGVVASSAWIFGETLLGRFTDIADGLERRTLAAALGLGLLAQSLFFLGVLGLLEPEIVFAGLAVGHLLGYRTWRSLPGRWRSVWQRLRRRERALVGRLACALLILAPCLVLALYPPTGFDATMYHLPFARSFADAGRLLYLPDLRVPVFPVAIEMIFVPFYFLSGDVAAKLTQLLAMLLTAALIFAWGRRCFSGRVGLWAAALWLGVPLVVWLGASAYIDMGLTLFVTAAFYGWERWEESGNRRWLGLAGVFVGLAAGAKYVGLVFCAALLGLTVLRALKSRTLRPVVTLSLAAALTLAPYYLRIVYHTGNPVFPFYASVFGAGEWTIAREDVYPAAVSEPGPQGAGTGIARRAFEGFSTLLLVPWNGVFNRGVFHRQSPISPYYLVLIPLCLPLSLAAPRVRRQLLVVGGYGLFWALTFPDVRYLVPVLPLLHFGLAAGGERWCQLTAVRRWATSRAVTWGAAALLVAPGPLYAVYKIHEQGGLPVTAEQREVYLSERVPGYAAIRWLNATEGPSYTAYGLFGERLHYYARGRFLGDWFGPMRFSRILATIHDGEALHRELRGLGAGYFLVLLGHPGIRVPQDAFFREHFEPVVTDSEFVLYRLAERAAQSVRSDTAEKLERNH